jgi:hypothetical protein
MVSRPRPDLGNGLAALGGLGLGEDGRVCLQDARPFAESLEWELVNSASDQVYPSSGLKRTSSLLQSGSTTLGSASQHPGSAEESPPNSASPLQPACSLSCSRQKKL